MNLKPRRDQQETAIQTLPRRHGNLQIIMEKESVENYAGISPESTVYLF